MSVEANAEGRLDRVLIAMLALLALASFDAVQPLAGAVRELGATVAAGGRVLELVDRGHGSPIPTGPLPLPVAPVAVCLEDVRARYGPHEPPVLEGASLRLEPG